MDEYRSCLVRSLWASTTAVHSVTTSGLLPFKSLGIARANLEQAKTSDGTADTGWLVGIRASASLLIPFLLLCHSADDATPMADHAMSIANPSVCIGSTGSNQKLFQFCLCSTHVHVYAFFWTRIVSYYPFCFRYGFHNSGKFI